MSTTTSREPVLITMGLYGPMKTLGSMKEAASAAFTSSTRLVRVKCGAVFTVSGSVSISLAIEIMASMNRSSSRLPSVSVGSIIMAPRTISGKLTV